MIAVYGYRIRENFSNVNYLLHVAIVLDPRYKMK